MYPLRTLGTSGITQSVTFIRIVNRCRGPKLSACVLSTRPLYKDFHTPKKRKQYCSLASQNPVGKFDTSNIPSAICKYVWLLGKQRVNNPEVGPPI